MQEATNQINLQNSTIFRVWIRVRSTQILAETDLVSVILVTDGEAVVGRIASVAVEVNHVQAHLVGGLARERVDAPYAEPEILRQVPETVNVVRPRAEEVALRAVQVPVLNNRPSSAGSVHVAVDVHPMLRAELVRRDVVDAADVVAKVLHLQAVPNDHHTKG